MLQLTVPSLPHVNFSRSVSPLQRTHFSGLCYRQYETVHQLSCVPGTGSVSGRLGTKKRETSPTELSKVRQFIVLLDVRWLRDEGAVKITFLIELVDITVFLVL